MAGTLWYDGPMPELAGDHWCTLCAMLYKGSANQSETAQALINQVNALSEEESRTINISGLGKLPGLKEPQPAVAMFVSPILQQVIGQIMGLPPGMVAPPMPVPLCWSHLFGLQLKPGGGVIPATAEQMPHERGAVDLSRRR